MEPTLDDELFHKLLKLFFNGFQVTFLSQIYSSDIIFELECSKNGNSYIQQEI